LAPYGAEPRFVACTTTSKFTAVEFLDFIWHDVAGMTTEVGEVPAGFRRPRPCIIVLDNSSVHTSKLVKAQWARLAAADIQLFYLPTYSPFLNLIEAFWRQIKHHEVPLRSYLTLEALLAAVLAALAPYVQGHHFSTNDFRRSA
jgi:transposase